MRSLSLLLIITALTTKGWGEFYLDASRCEFGKINFQASNLQGSNDYISEEFVELNEGDVLYVLNFSANYNSPFYFTANTGGNGTVSSINIGIYTKDHNEGEYFDAISYRSGGGMAFLNSAFNGIYLVGPTKVYIGLPFSANPTSYAEYRTSDNAFECSLHYAIQRKRVVNPQVVND
jgi:hypothetical protein